MATGHVVAVGKDHLNGQVVIKRKVVRSKTQIGERRHGNILRPLVLQASRRPHLRGQVVRSEETILVVPKRQGRIGEGGCCGGELEVDGNLVARVNHIAFNGNPSGDDTRLVFVLHAA